VSLEVLNLALMLFGSLLWIRCRGCGACRFWDLSCGNISGIYLISVF